LIVLLLASIALFAESAIHRDDFALEYRGHLNTQLYNATIHAQSESLETTLRGDGAINYRVHTRIGPVSHGQVQLTPSSTPNSFTGTLTISFGASHISQPHQLVAQSLGTLNVVPSDHEFITIAGHFNITQGLGAFAGAIGAIDAISYTTVTGNNANHESIWLLTSVFWYYT